MNIRKGREPGNEALQVKCAFSEPRGAWFLFLTLVFVFNPFVAAQVLIEARLRIELYGAETRNVRNSQTSLHNEEHKRSCPQGLPRVDRMAGKH